MKCLVEQLACSTLKDSGLRVGVHTMFPLLVLDLKKIGMGKGILAKTRNIQFYEKACSISPVVTLKTDVTKEKKTKYHLRSCLNRTAQNRHTVNVYWC